MTLTKDQQCLVQELIDTDTELFYLTPRDCKQLARGLARMGVQTPQQLRDWLEVLHQTDN